jgi:hypothetical protein
MTETEERVLAAYDVYDIWRSQMDYYIEEEGMTEEEASSAFSDSDIYEWAWDDFVDMITDLMHEMPNYTGYWHVEGWNLGWRNVTGYADIQADEGLTLLRGILPKTDVTLQVTKPDEGTMLIKCWHHDSPTGEYYSIVVDPDDGDDYE